jgi:hypothetical protein
MTVLSSHLYLSARSPFGGTISDALNAVPAVDSILRAIGWQRPIDDMVGDAEFYTDICAFGFVMTEDAAHQAIAGLAGILDRHAEVVSADHIVIQAWHVSEKMDRPVRGATLHWSRTVARELGSHGSNVIAMRPTWART